MKLPDWLPTITKKDEKLRAAHGLTPKRDGWYKSIRGKTRYIAKPMPVTEAVAIAEARMKLNDAAPQMRVATAAITLEKLADMFLEDMRLRMKTSIPRPMARRTYEDYVDVLTRFCAVVGLDRLASNIGPADFTKYVRTLAGRSATTRRREIQYIDRLFNWAGPGPKSKNIIPIAVRGPDWIKPGDKELMTAGGDADKAYTLDQLRDAFKKAKADPLALAAAHLGFGSGFIPKDIATLPEANVDLDDAIIIFRRGKTGISRMCPLMPEAVAALRDYLAKRPKQCKPEAAGLFFRTKYGNPVALWHEGDGGAREDNRVTRVWRRLMGKNSGLAFTGLRSTVATLVDDFPDQRAIDVVLGHSAGKKGRHIRTKHYAKQFKPERARALVEYAYAQVFPAPLKPAEPMPSAAA